MSEDYGSQFIMDTLINSAAVLALCPKTSIYDAPLIPTKVKLKTAINYYTVDTYSLRTETFQRTWSVDCRAVLKNDSRDLAQTVAKALSRINAVQNGFTYFAVCDILNIINPVDSDDVYNSPVQVLLRRK